MPLVPIPQQVPIERAGWNTDYQGAPGAAAQAVGNVANPIMQANDIASQQAQNNARTAQAAGAVQDLQDKQRSMQLSMLSGILNEPDPDKQRDLITKLVPLANQINPRMKLDASIGVPEIRALVTGNAPVTPTTQFQGNIELQKAALLADRMYNQPEQVYDKSTGQYAFVTKRDAMSQPDRYQPANTVPDIEKSVPSSFGGGITKESTTNDQKRIADEQAQLANVNFPKLDSSYQQTLQILNNNPQINPATPSSPMANALMPNFFGGMSAEDAKNLQTNAGILKGAAMANAKNVRNQREFDAITSQGNLLGGDQASSIGQVNAAYLAPLVQREKVDFLKNYQSKYKTLEGADEVWNQYLQNNPPEVRDANGNITSINKDALTPKNWRQYVDNAPQIYNQGNGAQPQQPANALTQAQSMLNKGQPQQATPIDTPDAIGKAYQSGKISEQQARMLLAKHGYK